MDNINKNTGSILFFIILTGFFLRFIMFSGFVGGDDIAYIANSVPIANGDFTPPETHWGTRTFPVLLTSLSIFLFGLSDFSIVLFPFITSIFGVLIAFLIGKQLFDDTTGLLSALLVAVFPLEILFASQLFPFVFLSVFSALCFYLFLRGEEKESSQLLFFSGVALGLAFTSRVTALYCLLFFGLYLLWKRKFLLRYAYFIVGLLLVSLLEFAYYYLITGDALHRFEVLANQQLSSGTGIKIVNMAGQIDKSSLKWVLEPFIRPILEQELGFTFLILWPIVIYQIFKKNAAVALLLLWIIPLFIYINYGTTSPFKYYPLRRLPRYLSVISIPIMILIAWHLRSVGYKWRNWLIGLTLASSVLALLLDNSPQAMSREKSAVEYINSHPNETFYVSNGIYFNIKFYLDFIETDKVILLRHKKGKPFFISKVEPNIAWEKSATCGSLIIANQNELDKNFKEIDYKVLQNFEWELNLYRYVRNHEYFLQAIALFRDNARMLKMRNSSNNSIILAKVRCSVDE